MYAWRYLDDKYTEDPDFVFNRPEYRKASILISGDNLAQDRPENTQLGL